jgi:hypothetical protein
MSPNEALKYLIDHDFCNPHQLVRDSRKLKLRECFFAKYLSGVSTYLVNMVKPPLETHEKIVDIVTAH